MSCSAQVLEELCEGLTLPEGVQGVQERFIQENSSFEQLKQHYAASIISYSHNRLAGRIGYKLLMDNLGDLSSLNGYADRTRGLLRPEITLAILATQTAFQGPVLEADKQMAKNFDWVQWMGYESIYLLRDSFEGRVVETPAQLHLRVALELYVEPDSQGIMTRQAVKDALTYFCLATKPYFSMASPVLFNSGLPKPNLCSCFLIPLYDDLPSIMDAMRKTALVSKAMGGVGLDVSEPRHSEIGKRGMSRGVIPMLQVVDRLIRYVDQTGKRRGAATAFLQAHHIDLLPFIRATLKNTDDHNRFETLNTAIMFPDIFWDRVREDGNWTVFCPAKFPGLNESCGQKYRELYLKYESMSPSDMQHPGDERYRKTCKARDVMNELARSQIMSGMPYVLHKDSINACSNQVNFSSPNKLHHRVIRQSNLCLEIMEQTDKDEVACCNLGQLSLKAFVRGSGIDHDYKGLNFQRWFDFDALGSVVGNVVGYLDRIIDRNNYVFTEARNSNMRHRPIGLGVSGYSDALELLRIPMESEEASELNRKIFACIYFNALARSVELAILSPEGPYSSFHGSPLSEGRLAFDMWKVRDVELRPDEDPRSEVDPKEWSQRPITLLNGDVIKSSWDSLRKIVKERGVRNSQLIALMPSASTSRLMSNAENVEAHQNLLHIRNFMSHSSVIFNPRAYSELADLGLWDRHTAEFIVADGGSIQRLPEFLMATMEDKSRIEHLLPQLQSVCARFKTMFEMKQKTLLRQQADRQMYVCQGISANVYLREPTITMLQNLHLHTHRSGLKTGMYYLREPPPVSAPRYARTSDRVAGFLTGGPPPPVSREEAPACSMRGDTGCVACDS